MTNSCKWNGKNENNLEESQVPIISVDNDGTLFYFPAKTRWRKRHQFCWLESQVESFLMYLNLFMWIHQVHQLELITANHILLHHCSTSNVQYHLKVQHVGHQS